MSTNRPVIVGSRASALALAQSRLVIAALQALHPGVTFELRQISTHGDRVLDRSLNAIGGKGVFVKEIEDALLAGEIDLAVHSLKDLPTEQPAGLTVAAIPERADARDALVTRDGRGLAGLARGARVGTSSLRRAAQLSALRPALQALDIRGNVDTRLRKLDEGQYDAIILAAAGLSRLDLSGRVAEYLDPEQFLPAPGQGALAVEVRAGDTAIATLAAPLDHQASRQAIAAERGLLQGLGGGCELPMGAYARIEGPTLFLRGMLADGARLLRASGQAPAGQAAELGQRLAGDILRRRDGGR